MSMAAKQARGKKANDMIFATNSQAQEAVRQYGKENVANYETHLLPLLRKQYHHFHLG